MFHFPQSPSAFDHCPCQNSMQHFALEINARRRIEFVAYLDFANLGEQMEASYIKGTHSDLKIPIHLKCIILTVPEGNFILLIMT